MVVGEAEVVPDGLVIVDDPEVASEAMIVEDDSEDEDVVLLFEGRDVGGGQPDGFAGGFLELGDLDVDYDSDRTLGRPRSWGRAQEVLVVD